MKEYVGKQLAWVQPKALKHVWELHAGDEVVGNLEWPDGFGNAAKAKYGDESWRIMRQGFLRPRVTVWLGDSDKEIAGFEPAWSGGGELDIGSARRLRLGPASIWRSEWRVSTPDGSVLLRMLPDTRFVHTTAQLEIDPAAASMPELSLLVMLSWAVMALMEDDLAIYSI